MNLHELVTPIDPFAEQSLATTYFYSVERGGRTPDVDIHAHAAELGLKVIKPLQYGEQAKRRPHMFLAENEQGIQVKIRVCFSDLEAKRIADNITFARNIHAQTPGFITRKGNILVVEYVEGDNILEPSIDDVKEIAQAHASLNRRFPELATATKKSLQNLLTESFQAIRTHRSDAAIDDLETLSTTLFPTRIIPVFDHQDAGAHNTVKGEDGTIWIIDEEAFGIVPFGYTVERALHGRKGYTTCHTDEQREIYLSQFPNELQEYYHTTRKFWEIVLKVRSAGRGIINGSTTLANELK